MSNKISDMITDDKIIISLEEVEQIIEKRLREDAYDELIQDVLREFEERK